MTTYTHNVAVVPAASAAQLPAALDEFSRQGWEFVSAYTGTLSQSALDVNPTPVLFCVLRRNDTAAELEQTLQTKARAQERSILAQMLEDDAKDEDEWAKVQMTDRHEYAAKRLRLHAKILRETQDVAGGTVADTARPPEAPHVT